MDVKLRVLLFDSSCSTALFVYQFSWNIFTNEIEMKFSIFLEHFYQEIEMKFSPIL